MHSVRAYKMFFCGFGASTYTTLNRVVTE